MDLYAYIYRYDYLDRLVYKKLPGCSPSYLVYDSVYYLPTHTVPQSEKRYIWNKKFKVYPLYLNSYYYRIDSVEHTVYWDGEIEEIAGRKFKR